MIFLMRVEPRNGDRSDLIATVKNYATNEGRKARALEELGEFHEAVESVSEPLGLAASGLVPSVLDELQAAQILLFGEEGDVVEQLVWEVFERLQRRKALEA